MNTSCVLKLLEPIAAELERPRVVPAQVINHLGSTYGLDRSAVGPFLVNELPRLEDFEIDLILSPLFTPGLNDQAVMAELLGRESLPADQWPSVVQSLVARPTCAQLVTEDGQTNLVPLRVVTIERYVHRLRLDGTFSETLFQMISHLPPADDRPLLKAIARRAIWENPARRDVLIRYLTTATIAGAYRREDAVELLRLMEIYEPSDVADLRGRIPHWQQVLRQEINQVAGPKPFFNERVQEMHGGGRDQRRQDNSRLAAKEAELAFLDRLQTALNHPTHGQSGKSASASESG